MYNSHSFLRQALLYILAALFVMSASQAFAQGGGGPGENTEGIYSELNDTGSNQNVYYNLVNGRQLPHRMQVYYNDLRSGIFTVKNFDLN